MGRRDPVRHTMLFRRYGNRAEELPRPPRSAGEARRMGRQGRRCVRSGILATWRMRRRRPRFAGVPSGALAAAGVAVVGLAVTLGVRAQLAAAPQEFAAYVTAAVGVNLGVGLVASVLFAQWGTRYACTAGLVSGNRNVTLAWAAAGTTLPAPSEGYMAACVIPVLSLPLVLETALRIRAGRLGTTA